MGLFSGGLFGGGSFTSGSSGRGLFGGSSSSGGFSGHISGNGIMPEHPLGDVNDIIRMGKQSNSLLGEFCEIIDDARNEFHELCTDGFVEMVIKGNKDYQTSFAIRDKADEKVTKAVCSYSDRCSAFNQYLNELNNEINTLYCDKAALARRIHKAWTEEKANLPVYSKAMTVPVYSYKEATIDMLCTPLKKTSGIDRNSKGRKESAKAYLEDAKDYETAISAQIAEINQMEAILNTVKLNLYEERQLIDALNDSLDSKRDLQYQEIEKRLTVLLSEYILDKNGERNKKYLDAIVQLKSICDC